MGTKGLLAEEQELGMEGVGSSKELRGGKIPTAHSLVCRFPPCPKAKLRKPGGFSRKEQMHKDIPTRT